MTSGTNAGSEESLQCGICPIGQRVECKEGSKADHHDVCLLLLLRSADLMAPMPGFVKRPALEMYGEIKQRGERGGDRLRPARRRQPEGGEEGGRW